MFRFKKKSEKDDVLLTADEAFEQMKGPQLEHAKAKINEAVKKGRMTAYIGECQEMVCVETVEELLKAGYDISISKYGIGSDETDWFTQVFFDGDHKGVIRDTNLSPETFQKYYGGLEKFVDIKSTEDI